MLYSKDHLIKLDVLDGSIAAGEVACKAQKIACLGGSSWSCASQEL